MCADDEDFVVGCGDVTDEVEEGSASASAADVDLVSYSDWYC